MHKISIQHSLVLLSTTLLALSMSFSSCQNEVAPTTPSPYSPPTNLSKLVPLEIGNSWTYRVIQSYFTGGISDTSFDTTQIVDTFQVAGTKQYLFRGTSSGGDLLWFQGRYSESLDSSDFISSYWPTGLSIRKQGVLYNDSVRWPMYILKSPLVKGKQWVCLDGDSLYRKMMGTMRIVTADTTLVLPIGRFEHTIYVREESDFLGGGFFIAPGVGVVLHGGGMSPDIGYSRELIDWKVR